MTLGSSVTQGLRFRRNPDDETKDWIIENNANDNLSMKRYNANKDEYDTAMTFQNITAANGDIEETQMHFMNNTATLKYDKDVDTFFFTGNVDTGTKLFTTKIESKENDMLIDTSDDLDFTMIHLDHNHRIVNINTDVNIKGTLNTINREHLNISDDVIVIANNATTQNEADGAGIEIHGADMNFKYNTITDRMYLDKGLGVLTQSPTRQLDIDGDARVRSTIRTPHITSDGANVTIDTSNTTDVFYIQNSDGNVGIGGETNPSNQLDVKNTIRAQGKLRSSKLESDDSQLTIETLGNNDIEIKTPSADNRIYIEDSTSSVAIGWDNPQYLLDVSGDTRVSGTTRTEHLTSDGGDLAIDTSDTTDTLYIQNSDGNVGVGGVTAPSYQLDVNGDIATNSSLLTPKISTDSGNLTIETNNNSDIEMKTTNTNNRIYIEDSTENVAIGSDNPQYLLDVNGDTRVAGTIRTEHLTSDGDDLTIDTSDTTDTIYIRNSDGNIGVGGVTEPSYQLDVNGDISTNSNLYVKTSIGVDTINLHKLESDGRNLTVTTKNNSDIEMKTTNTKNRIYIEDSTENVAIGSDNPQYLLDVSGDTRVAGTTRTEHLTSDGDDLAIDTSDTTDTLYIQNSNGNVGVGGVTTPSYQLDVNGDISTNSNLYVNSDISTNSNLYVNTSIGVGTTSPSYDVDAINDIRAQGVLRSEKLKSDTDELILESKDTVNINANVEISNTLSFENKNAEIYYNNENNRLDFNTKTNLTIQDLKTDYISPFLYNSYRDLLTIDTFDRNQLTTTIDSSLQKKDKSDDYYFIKPLRDGRVLSFISNTKDIVILDPLYNTLQYKTNIRETNNDIRDITELNDGRVVFSKNSNQTELEIFNSNDDSIEYIGLGFTTSQTLSSILLSNGNALITTIDDTVIILNPNTNDIQTTQRNNGNLANLVKFDNGRVFILTTDYIVESSSTEIIIEEVNSSNNQISVIKRISRNDNSSLDHTQVFESDKSLLLTIGENLIIYDLQNDNVIKTNPFNYTIATSHKLPNNTVLIRELNINNIIIYDPVNDTTIKTITINGFDIYHTVALQNGNILLLPNADNKLGIFHYQTSTFKLLTLSYTISNLFSYNEETFNGKIIIPGNFNKNIGIVNINEIENTFDINIPGKIHEQGEPLKERYVPYGIISQSNAQQSSDINDSDSYSEIKWIYSSAIEADTEKGSKSCLLTIGNGAGTFTQDGLNIETLDDQFQFIANGRTQCIIKDNRFGIGFTNPQYLLDVSGDTRVAGTTRTEHLTSDGDDLAIDTSDTTDTLYIQNSDGNVGVGGITAPSCQLDVNGDISTNSNLYVNTSIGVGETSPSYDVDAKNTIRAQENLRSSTLKSDGGDLTLTTVSNSDMIVLDDTNNVVKITHTNADVLYIKGDKPRSNWEHQGWKPSNTYFVLGETSSNNDNCVIRQVENDNSYHLTYDFTDNDGDVRFSIRNAPTSNNIPPNIETQFTVQQNKVGVNTSSPSYNLDVNGNINTNSHLYVDTSIGVGTTNPSYDVDATNTIRGQGKLRSSTLESDGNNLTLTTNNNSDIEMKTTNTNNRIYIEDSTENVAIGWDNPQYLLDISGDTRVAGTTRTEHLTSDGDDLAIDTSDTTDTLYIKNSDGNVGIGGVTAPSYQLDVNGDISTNSNLYVNSDISTNSNLYVNTSIGVGTTNPSYDVDATNTIRAQGTLRSSKLESDGGDLTVTTVSNNDMIVLDDTNNVVNIKTDVNIDGTLNTLNREMLNISDDTIVIAKNAQNSSEADAAGIQISGADVNFKYDNITDRMHLNKGLGILTEHSKYAFDVDGDARVRTVIRTPHLTSDGGDLSIDTSDTTDTLYIQNSDGNVGIGGVTAPSYQLDVNGDISTNSNLYVNSDISTNSNLYVNTSIGVGTTNPSYDVDATNTIRAQGTLRSSKLESDGGDLTVTTVSNNDMIVLDDTNNVVNIKTDVNIDGTLNTLNREMLNISDDTIVIAKNAQNSSEADAAGIQISGADVNFKYDNITDRMHLNKGLGILTENSKYAFDVDGDARVRTVIRTPHLTSDGGDLSIDTSDTTDTLYIQNSDGNVGIGGVTTPSYQLDVNGDISTNSNLYVNTSIGVGTTSPSYDVDATNDIRAQGVLRSQKVKSDTDELTLESQNNADVVVLDTNGNIGIGGETNPSYQLDVNGEARIQNDTIIQGSLTGNGSATFDGEVVAQSDYYFGFYIGTLSDSVSDQIILLCTTSESVAGTLSGYNGSETVFIQVSASRTEGNLIVQESGGTEEYTLITCTYDGSDRLGVRVQGSPQALSILWTGYIQDTTSVQLVNASNVNSITQVSIRDIFGYGKLTLNKTTKIGSPYTKERTIPDTPDEYYDFNTLTNNGASNSSATIYNAELRYDGIKGKYYYFNPSNKAYIEISNASSTNGTSALSLSSWIKRFGSSNNLTIINRKNSFRFSVENNNTLVFLLNTDNSGWNPITFHTNQVIQQDIWTHVGVIITSTSVQLFINGRRDTIYSHSQSILSGSNTIIIGGIEGIDADWFDGLIDEVIVYGKEISRAEMYELYQDISDETWAQFSHENRFNDTDYALLQNSSGETYLNAEATEQIHFTLGNTEYARLDSNGNFGIGTSTPGSQLDVNGTINAQGIIYEQGVSLKKDISDVAFVMNSANASLQDQVDTLKNTLETAPKLKCRVMEITQLNSDNNLEFDPYFSSLKTEDNDVSIGVNSDLITILRGSSDKWYLVTIRLPLYSNSEDRIKFRIGFTTASNGTKTWVPLIGDFEGIENNDSYSGYLYTFTQTFPLRIPSELNSDTTYIVINKTSGSFNLKTGHNKSDSHFQMLGASITFQRMS